MPSNHLILCRPLLLLPSIFPSIRVFSNESVLHIRWPKYWTFQHQTLLSPPDTSTQQRALFPLWLRLFIPSAVISPLISSSTLGTFQPGEFLFLSVSLLSFHAVHGVLKARIQKRFAIPFSTGPCFVRTLHRDPSVLGVPMWHGSQFH